MTLPRKKSRGIVVGGIGYRWAISAPLDGPNDLHRIQITIQLETGNGPKLIASGVCATHEYLLEPEVWFRPQHIAELVTFAIEHGWCPTSEGRNFVIENVLKVLQDCGLPADTV